MLARHPQQLQEPASQGVALPSATQLTAKPWAEYGAATVPPYPTPIVKVALTVSAVRSAGR